MSDSAPSPGIAAFRRPDGPAVIVVGALMMAAAFAGAVAAVLMLRHPDLKTITIISLGLFAVSGLGLAFIHAGRCPLLVVRPDAVIIPTLCGTRQIPVRAGQNLGEMLAHSARAGGNRSPGEGHKFVHFYLRDANGQPIELLALHRDAPDLIPIRRALAEIAGLKFKQLRAIKLHAQTKPDFSDL